MGTKQKKGARPLCSKCKSPMNFETLSGILVYSERNGKRVYRTRCSNCNNSSEVVRVNPLPASWSRNRWEMD